MPSNRYPIIAREGWLMLLIVATIGVFLVLEFTPSFSIPVWIILLGLIYLFRDPYRIIPSSPLAVVSPVEGIVESVTEVKDHWLDRDAIRIRIRMGLGTSFSMRSPIEGKMVQSWSSEPASLGNSDRLHRHAFCIRSDEDDDIITAIYVGKIASRLRCYTHPGERVGQGQRCGYFFLGGVIEVYLPTDCRVGVKPGDSVLSGSSVLGHVHHHAPITSRPLTTVG